MVQQTHPDCLPYFEGTDSPCVNTGTLCEPSTVWCDFAEGVEEALDEFDDVVTVLENPPMAWIETLIGTTVVVDTIEDQPVIFETVRVDTANMVNLDALPSAIRIPRTGLYTTFCYVRCTTDLVAPGDFIELVISTTAVPVLTVPITLADTTPTVTQAVNQDDVQLAPGVQYPTYYQEGQTVSMLLNCNGATDGRIITLKISMGIAWLGDAA